MNLVEIKSAVLDGKRVYWKSTTYKVILDSVGQWLIVCSLNNYCIGLTWQDGVTLNGKETDFFIE